MNKNIIYRSPMVPILNIWLAAGALFFVVGLVGPLFGGDIQIGGMLHAITWVIYAVILKYYYLKREEGVKLGEFEYLLIIAGCIAIMFLWFSFPLNIVASIIHVAGFFYGYREQKREKQL